MKWNAPPNPREFVLASRRLLLDPVTELPGPALLTDRLEVALARARRERRGVAVFVLHDVAGSPGPGLREMAERLQHAVRPDDTVSRICGRTFVVVCNQIDDRLDAEAVGERLMEYVGPGCRVGVVLGTPADDARDLLLIAADRAVAAAPKRRSGGRASMPAAWATNSTCRPRFDESAVFRDGSSPQLVA
jgi:GGDEF domain-containing protein